MYHSTTSSPRVNLYFLPLLLFTIYKYFSPDIKVQSPLVPSIELLVSDIFNCVTVLIMIIQIVLDYLSILLGEYF